MKPKTFVLMTVAIGCGLVAAFLTAQLSQPSGAPETVDVLVAVHDIGAGTVIQEPQKLFKPKRFLRSEQPAQAINDYEQLRGQILNKGLAADQFCTLKDLSKDAGLDRDLPPGMRAMPVKADVQNAGAFILPKSHVDVISTMRLADGQVSAKTILQRMLVLAVDDNCDREKVLAMTPRATVTLAVTPKQAETLAGALESGTLRLSLVSSREPPGPAVPDPGDGPSPEIKPVEPVEKTRDLLPVADETFAQGIHNGPNSEWNLFVRHKDGPWNRKREK